MIFGSFFDVIASIFTGASIENRLEQRKEDERLVREIGDSASESALNTYQEMPDIVEGPGSWIMNIRVDDDAIN